MSSDDEAKCETNSLEKHDVEKQPISEVIPIGDEFADPNFDPTIVLLEDESPYPEVRSAVSNTDDPLMPSATARAWIIGIIWAIIIPGVNQFFYFRFPSVTIGTLVPQLLTFPVVKLWARYVPRVRLFGYSLNGGPFTIKEHVIITVMASVGAVSAYATDIVAVQRVFYSQKTNFGYQWMLVMSTQLIGFSIGGLCRRFLVAPPSMIWPANLVSSALFNTLHQQETAGSQGRGGISRERFFTYVFVAYFVWNFVPTYLFTALGTFAWVTWIRPNDIKINQLFGTSHGLAMSVLTFDWGQITFLGSPLPVPWWAIANIGIAMVIFYWIVVPIVYYTNTWFTAYLPMVSDQSFDNTGAVYNVTRIINPDLSLNVAEYKNYSPLFLPAAFAISYGLSFASITATLMHVFLYYRSQIWKQARRSLGEQPDVHARLMSVYAGVPDWWYGCIFLVMFVFGVIVVEVFHTDFPVWAFCLAVIISFFYTIPVGIIQAITNQQVGLNVLTELIVGYMLPGRPIAMMMFKTWGFITMAQALTFTSDFKLGHYMKIPPRQMFTCQVVATVIAGTVQLAVQAWMFTNIPDICSQDQPSNFVCPNTTVFGTASIIWGVIGPARQFSKGNLFYGLVFFFLVGFIAPLVQWALHKRFRFGILKYLNFPVVFSGPGFIPPATPLNYMPWVLVGFIFNYVVRRRHFSWWAKYNYVLSAGLDSGYAIGTLFVFFCLQFPMNGSIGANTIQKWWGNNGAFNTADVAGTPLLQPPSDTGKFGPTVW